MCRQKPPPSSKTASRWQRAILPCAPICRSAPVPANNSNLPRKCRPKKSSTTNSTECASAAISVFRYAICKLTATFPAKRAASILWKTCNFSASRATRQKARTGRWRNCAHTTAKKAFCRRWKAMTNPERPPAVNRQLPNLRPECEIFPPNML